MNIHFCPSFCSRLGCFILKHYAIFNYFAITKCFKISDTIPVSCKFYDLLACFEGISAEGHQAEGRQSDDVFLYGDLSVPQIATSNMAKAQNSLVECFVFHLSCLCVAKRKVVTRKHAKATVLSIFALLPFTFSALKFMNFSKLV